MTKEIWKDVVGYEGLYQVSNKGRVISKRRLGAKGGERKLYLTDRGYYTVALHKNGVRKRIYVHRIVAEAFIPNIEGKPFIDHINGISTDNRVENLRWATAKENLNNPVTLIRKCRYSFKGKPLSVYAQDTGLNYNTIINRIRIQKRPVSSACDTHVERLEKLNGRPVVDIARENSINEQTLYTRVRRGWSIEDACTLPVKRGRWSYAILRRK